MHCQKEKMDETEEEKISANKKKWEQNFTPNPGLESSAQCNCPPECLQASVQLAAILSEELEFYLLWNVQREYNGG